MNENCHTVILKCDLCPLPEENGLRDFIAERLASERTEVEYFGCELDSGWDYIDEELKTHILKACYITLQFEEKNAPSYDTDKTEIKRFMADYFKEFSSRIIVDSDRKDIEVYFD